MVWQICIDNCRAQTNQFQREYEIVTGSSLEIRCRGQSSLSDSL